MQDFFYNVPTKVSFGKNAINGLGGYIKEYGTSVLIVYGGGSIKKNGIYASVVELLEKSGLSFQELSGVEPNPQIETVRKGVSICKNRKIDVVLPIGGGSTIDCAKAIAAGAFYNGDPWELVMDNSKITNALPIIVIATMAATGSEMDCFAVISNQATKDKKELESSLLYPKYAILNPIYTYSVSKYQTAAGVVDMMSHIMEVYFNEVKETYLQDRIMEALLKTCVKYGKIACEQPTNYEARANLMWASEWAINGFIACGKLGEWPIHALEHQLSAYYDVTHGHGLAILIPSFLEYLLDSGNMSQFVNYACNVWGISKEQNPMEAAKEGIRRTEEFFCSLGLTPSLSSVGITEESNFFEMAQKACGEGIHYGNYKITKQDAVALYQKCS